MDRLPKCARCSLPILGSDPVQGENGDLLHTACWRIDVSARAIAESRKRQRSSRRTLDAGGGAIRCDRCGGGISNAGDLVLADTGAFHRRCAQPATESTASILRQAPGRRLCAACLSRITGLSLTDVQEATATLRDMAGFFIEIGATCGACSTDRITITYLNE